MYTYTHIDTPLQQPHAAIRTATPQTGCAQRRSSPAKSLSICYARG